MGYAVMTAREAAIIALGPDEVRAYERVKRFYTRFGLGLQRTFARAVGGRSGARGEFDVITRLGEWEFCAAANTKNGVGNRAQRAKAPGYIVQATGTPARGRISGVEFLRLHGVRFPERVAGECVISAMEYAKEPDPTLSLF